MALYSAIQRFITKNGAPVAGASCVVLVDGGATQPTLYASRTGGALSNPFLTDSQGNALCFVAPGRYKMIVTKDAEQVTFEGIEVGPVSLTGNFADGGVVSDPDQWFVDAAGNQWAWVGALNKTVAPGEDPTLDADWVLMVDKALRGDLASGDAVIGATTIGGLLSGLFKFPKLLVGSGVKGNPQTNVGVQVHRDITETSPSYHGFNCADYFAGGTNALNPFGADIQIGDGTQGAEVVLGHVNDFQVTDITDLGGGRNAQHYCFISQPRLESGTISRTSHFLAVDQLGVRDTPGFGVPNFEVNGPAVCNNQTGLVTVIRHGTNAKSIHVQAGSTDAGALKTSGGAPVDIEAPVIIRETAAATTRTNGALVIAGGIGCAGAIHAGASVNAYSNSGPQFALRSEAGTLQGRLNHDGTNLLVTADVGIVRVRAGGVTGWEFLADRFRPTTDNAYTLGDTTHRPTVIYAVSDTINTSDGNEKTEPQPIDTKILEAWADVSAVSFQWLDSVAKKGGAARVHHGWIAQHVQSALEKHGIDGFKYGLLCSDPVIESVEKKRIVKRQKTQVVNKVVDSVKIIDGKPVLSYEKIQEEVLVFEEKEIVGEDGKVILFDHTEPKVVNVPVKKKRMGGLLGEKIIGQKQVTQHVKTKRPKLAQVPVYEDAEEIYYEEVDTGRTRLGLRLTQCLIVECAYIRSILAVRG